MEKELQRIILTDNGLTKAYKTINDVVLEAIPIGMNDIGFIYDDKVNKLIDAFNWYIDERTKQIIKQFNVNKENIYYMKSNI